jgi:serine/threonine protein phosphatase PrpC
MLRNLTIENGLQPFENSKVADSVGCTANVCLLVGKTIYVANAGDSRAALSRKGEILELSEDHKPENPLELERIVSSGSKVEGGRINNHLNLSRCLGDTYYKKNPDL